MDPTCEPWDAAQLKDMVPATYCQTFLHLIQQLVGHVKGNQRNMDKHLFCIEKKREKKPQYACMYSSTCS